MRARRLCRGSMRAECLVADENVPARVASGRRGIERACLDEQGEDVTFVDSQLWRLVPERRLDFGRVASGFAARVSRLRRIDAP